ncbi:MAG: DUF302 domain-containing protein [Actinomycetia bacterium]|nr:DUF302 domain-containing protein [Actinomycetes bacterium]
MRNRRSRIAAVIAVSVVSALLWVGPVGAGPPPPQVSGMVMTESTMSFQDTWDALFTAIDSNPNIGIAAVVDHAANAASVGLDLPPNREIFFGNPRIGTPLMQQAPTAGIDLPLKMLVWEDAGRVFVGYNAVEYLAAHHGLVSPILGNIAAALRGLAGAATGTDVDDTRVHGMQRYENNPGLVTIDSTDGFDTTLGRLLSAIDGSPANVAFTVDHSANATSVGMDLPPNTLVVFGNPNLGTPLMQAAPTSGIDLPLKMLVWDDFDGTTHISYTDMGTLNKRHHFRGQPALLKVIDGALSNFASAAAG